MTVKRAAIAGVVLSAAGLVGIANSEFFTDRAIIPVPGDVPTYGFGSTRREDGSPVRLGDTITPPAALRLTMADIAKKESAIKRCVHVDLFQHEYDAYIQLTVNIGETAFCNSTLVKKLNLMDYAAACAEISRWDKFKGKPLRGLTIRRARERALCEGK